MDRESAAAIAAALAGTTIVAARPAGGGGNSRLMRIEAADGEVFALKLYPPRDADPRDRLGAEAQALEFMRDAGITCVPRLIGTDRNANCALLSWAEGDLDEDASNDSVDQALAFLTALYHNRSTDAARGLPLASEACLSAAELIAQVEGRFRRLSQPAAHHAGLAELMDQGLLPFLDRARRALETGYGESGHSVADAVAGRTLSPSDFGFHNALKAADGMLTFIDFEYFGWDDPVKLVADTMLHPRNRLAPGPRRRLTDGMKALYGSSDGFFAARLALQLPLFGLRWCAILLNEFLPEKWAVRAHAGHQERETAQTRQLAKARTLFETLSRTHDPAFS